MSLKITRTPEADIDALNAAEFIAARFSLNASDKFLEAVKSSCQRIADMPGIGTERSYGQPALKGMRMWPVAKYPRFLIFYIATGTEVLILRVLNGSQDIDAIFSREVPE